MAEYDTAAQEHLSKITQAQFVAEPPKDHERNHVARVLRPVQLTGAALIVLPVAIPVTKPTVALCRAFRPLCQGRQPATHTAHPRTPSPTGDTQTALSYAGQRMLPWREP